MGADVSNFCGAPTLKGTPCGRRVAAGKACPDHPYGSRFNPGTPRAVSQSGWAKPPLLASSQPGPGITKSSPIPTPASGPASLRPAAAVPGQERDLWPAILAGSSVVVSAVLGLILFLLPHDSDQLSRFGLVAGMVLIPAAASSFFLGRCWSNRTKTGHRCRRWRRGFLTRCHAHRGFTSFDAWGALSGAAAVVMLFWGLGVASP